MKKSKIKDKLENILPILSLSFISEKYYNKSRQWLYQKINESVVNGSKYKINDNEIDILISALKDIDITLNKSIQELEQIKKRKTKQKAKYYTKSNPFNHKLFIEWLNMIPNYKNSRFLEPFAGSNNIIKLVKDVDNDISNWVCFDIAPPVENNVLQYSVTKRDTIRNFPSGFNICITNPPYLAKNSATRRKLKYPDTHYDDVYKLCLDIMLSDCDYVVAILPESFITSNLFHNRLLGLISLNYNVFDDTNCPVCLALFIPQKLDDNFHIYIGNEYIGTYNQLKNYNLTEYTNNTINWKFNVPDGSIGVKCVDSQHGADIRFIRGDKINSDDIKISSRTLTRISGLPYNIELKSFIDVCNNVLSEYRMQTNDIFLTSFKGLRKDGKYRRRIDFKTIRCILNKATKTVFNQSILKGVKGKPNSL
ncbi:DUF5053 domain-containing protein [Dysgonomonas sp. 511]|uniref:DUF5053 domain-containing protein n=1 Tax=Dysgonomonas sp. 511 TaxID=2302930 RepID=UPI0013D48580|nr:DUF5053 domain-containing protein [Dysgonomonas sp. 511]NDV78755.1 DUF5053 domain-containing protein [Dysgonomonas sp. 511]